MSLDGAIVKVQRESSVDDDDTAEATLRATLEVLGERISREEAKDVAGQLPDEMETWVIDWDTESAQPFGVDEFCDRVADRLGVDTETAHNRAQAAVDALEMEISAFKRSAVQGQLPDEYDTLF
ncbi:DUF2267 domain-containing protein [Halobaculum sp. P14]|uniref:DUF2267 domain-containing protein n=1 Tax=Halobaculum sp. P14 TaxID=3421638 RepID=UPI003EBC4817